jgi:hypothetical protein
MKRNSCLLWNYILRVILSFDAFSFCCWATNLQGFAARTLHANILCFVHLAWLFQNPNSIERGWNPSHVVIASVFFFFACHRNRKRIHFNPSLQKPFFSCMHKTNSHNTACTWVQHWKKYWTWKWAHMMKFASYQPFSWQTLTLEKKLLLPSKKCNNFF